MIRALQVRIARRQVGQREFDCITVVIGDLHLRCDLTSDREIRLARDLAINHEAAFVCDDANAARVSEALVNSRGLVGRLPANTAPLQVAGERFVKNRA